MQKYIEDCLEHCHMALLDFLRAFLHARFDNDEIVCMQLEEFMTEAMVSIAPEVHGPYVTNIKKGQTVLNIKLTSALYGCLKLSIKFWKLPTGMLREEGFEENPQNTCVMNKKVNSS